MHSCHIVLLSGLFFHRIRQSNYFTLFSRIQSGIDPLAHVFGVVQIFAMPRDEVNRSFGSADDVAQAIYRRIAKIGCTVEIRSIQFCADGQEVIAVAKGVQRFEVLSLRLQRGVAYTTVKILDDVVPGCSPNSTASVLRATARHTAEATRPHPLWVS